MPLPKSAGRDICAQHGKAVVFPEQDTGNGTKIDIAVEKSTGLWLYEIKTSTCIRTCIREGLAQLMEYAFWSQGLTAARLIIVGEAQTDAGAIHYLDTLRKRFGLPVYYSRLDYARRTLGGEE
jgi:hypothetical protein